MEGEVVGRRSVFNEVGEENRADMKDKSNQTTEKCIENRDSYSWFISVSFLIKINFLLVIVSTLNGIFIKRKQNDQQNIAFKSLKIIACLVNAFVIAFNGLIRTSGTW